MSSIKTYNSKTGEWEVRGASQASSIGVVDLSGNFSSDNVEGCLRELSNTNNEQNALIEAVRGTAATSRYLVEELKKDFDEHVTNHPGGSGGGSDCKITSTFQGGVIEADKDLEIPIYFTSGNRGNGTLFITLNNVEIGMQIIPQGTTRINLGKLLLIENDIEIYVKDAKGVMSNLLFWQVIKGGIDFTINFDFNQDYSINDTLRIRYAIDTPLTDPLFLEIVYKGIKNEIPIESGIGEKIFKGSELGIGIHQATVRIISGVFSSQTYNLQLAIVSSYELYLSSNFKGGEFEYGSAVIIPYRISKISTEEFTVRRIFVGDDSKTKILSSQAGTYSWTIPTIPDLPIGTHKLRIEVEGVSGDSAFLEFDISIIAGSYVPLEPLKTGLLAWFDARDMSNEDVKKETWLDRSGNDVTAKLKNFNFKTNGWMEEKNDSGEVVDRLLACDNAAYVEIDMAPFETNAIYGLTIECLYKSHNIGYEDARILDCTEVVGVSEDGSPLYKGAFIDVVSACMRSDSQLAKVTLNEDTEVRITYVLDRFEKFCKIYIDGVLCRAFYLKDAVIGPNKEYENFQHAQKIYLNGEKGTSKSGACDIKTVRIYNMALDSEQVLLNHLSDIRDLKKQKEKYDFNFNKEISKTPTITMYGTKGKFDQMNGEQEVTIRVEYRSPNPDFYGESFDYANCSVKWQGSSSLEYVLKNYTIYLKDDSFTDMYYTPFKDGIPENVFCLKADYIESSHANNLGLAKFVHNCLYDIINPAQEVNRNYRTTIDGLPILVYIDYLDGKEKKLLGAYNFNLDRYSTYSYGYNDPALKPLAYEIAANSDITAGAFVEWTPESGKAETDYYKDSFELIYPPSRKGNDNYEEIKRVVRWVSRASEEQFKDQIHEYFNLEYLMRYYLMVMVVGAVDSLGKNMKMVSYDGGIIWYPEFYDMDTVLGLNNTGNLIHDSDIEVEEGVFMTTGSVLWHKLRTIFQLELRNEYARMRKNKFTEQNLMKYLYEDQIAKIPEYNYNNDAQTKYLDFGPLYLNVCHGNRLHHMKKWIRERLVYVDTLMGYTGETSDTITMRINKPGNVSVWLETYIPMYLTVKWKDMEDEIINGQIVNRGKTTVRVGRNEKVEFKGFVDTATHQNVFVYAGRYLKSIDGLSNLRVSEMLFSKATKLTKLECHSELLINTEVSKMRNLQYLNLSGCKIYGNDLVVEGGQKVLDLTVCKYLKKVDISDTSLTSLNINIDGGSIEEIIYPTAVQSVELSNQTRLTRIGIPYGYRSLLRNSKPIFGKKYEYYLTPEEIEVEPEGVPLLSKPKITNSANHLTFIDAIQIVSLNLYKIRMSKAGGSVTIHEFNTIGEKVGTTEISMTTNSIVNYTPGESVNQIVVVLDSNGVWTSSEMESCRLALEKDININDEATALQNFKLFNCKAIESLTQYPYPKSTNQFESIKHVQNLSFINSLDLTNVNFSGFSKLRSLNLQGIPSLETLGFNDMCNVGEPSVLGNVTLANCPKINSIEMNVTDAGKSVSFTPGAIMDLGSLYTLKTITSNTPIIGLETIILNRDIKNVIFGKEYGQSWDSDIKNIWSYDVASDNKEIGYIGIDFGKNVIQNIDLSATRKIPETKNFNIQLSDIFNINTTRDGNVYPFLIMNGTIDMTNYTGSCVNLFKNCDLRNVTLICNRDLEQTDFTSMFEGATFGDCDLTSIFNRIKNATNCTKMFAYSDVKNIDVVNLITFGANPDISYMFEGCSLPSETKFTIPEGVTQINGLFKNCTSLTIPPIEVIPDSVNGINELYSGCVSIKSINGMIIGSGVNAATNWSPPNLDTANDLTIKNNFITFENNKGIKSCTNLIFTSNRTSLENLFNGCLNLTEVSFNVLNNTLNVTTAARAFNECVSLLNLDLTNLNIPRCTNIMYMFNQCVKLTKLSLRGINVVDNSIGFIDGTSITEIKFTGNNSARAGIRNTLSSAPWTIKVIYEGINAIQSTYTKDFSTGPINLTNTLEKSTRDLELQGETYNNLVSGGGEMFDIAVNTNAIMPPTNGLYGPLLPNNPRSMYSPELGDYEAEILEISFGAHKENMALCSKDSGNMLYPYIKTEDGMYEHQIKNNNNNDICTFKTPIPLMGPFLMTSGKGRELDVSNCLFWSDELGCYCIQTMSLICKIVNRVDDISFVKTTQDKDTGELLYGYKIDVTDQDARNKVDWHYGVWWNYNICVDKIKNCGYWYQEYNSKYGHSVSLGPGFEVALPEEYNTKEKVYEFLKDCYGAFKMRNNYYVTTPLPDMNTKLKIKISQGNNAFESPLQGSKYHIDLMTIQSKALGLECRLKPNTTYYTQLDGVRVGSTPIRVSLSGAEGSQLLDTELKTFNIPITTPAEITSHTMVLEGVGSKVGNIKLFESRVAPQITKYFTGLSGVGEFDEGREVYKINLRSSNSDNTESNTKEFIVPVSLDKIQNLYDSLHWDEIKKHYVIEKRIAKMTIDSTLDLVYKNGVYSFPKPYNCKGYTTRNPYLMCSHINNLVFDRTDNTITFNKTDNIHIPNLVGDTTDVNTIKNYLDAYYPVVLLYELETPITYDLQQYNENIGNIRLWQNSTFVDFNNSIKPSKIKYDLMDIM